MDMLSSLLGPDAMGWAAALLTILTFVSVDMRQLRLLALAANATFIAYGAAAELLPVLALHLALVPVNLWRLNQTFRRHAPSSRVQSATAQRQARQARGWSPAQRASRISRRKAVSSMSSQPSETDGRTTATDVRNHGETCLT